MTKPGLYLQLFSIHGLIRGESPELGYDADTGGQVKYVLELTRALAAHPEVGQVDLVTRLIEDRQLSPAYARAEERISDKARIIRIQCGGKKYIRKELLWPHLDEFIDRTLKLIKARGRIPDIFHGHYADAGYVAMELAATFNAPFVFTGHSLGRNKKAKLLAGSQSVAEINRRYRIDHRISVEEDIIKKASLIITSTSQEIDKQYGLYDNAGRRPYAVIPPGIDLDTFYPYCHSSLPRHDSNETAKQTRLTLQRELQRFWAKPDKPFILALCRPDQRKNITGLIEAYGANLELRSMANLAIFAGIRKDIRKMENNERDVLTDMLLKMDQYELYGKLAIPKKHDFASEVPELYRLCAGSGGVFVNPALVEPFGLTIIEASACGLPIIATNDGGPVDIVAKCASGILVDVASSRNIGSAIREMLVDHEKWRSYSRNGIKGVRRHYSWASHCQRTVDSMKSLLPRKFPQKPAPPAAARACRPSFGCRLTSLKKMLITDIDNTLVGDRKLLAELLDLLHANRERIGWGVATGRSLEMTLDIMSEQQVPIPDVLICSVGTEIYYGPDLRMDNGWQQHLNHRWRPGEINRALAGLEFLSPQGADGQRHFKISYFMPDDKELLDCVIRTLRDARLRCRIIYSRGKFLDILPARAGKGKAICYLKNKWGIAPANVMVAGDSGNDEDMLLSRCSSLVVGNHSRELDNLQGKRGIFFSRHQYAGGIIDGLKHYKFL